jgi:hypothetical protein
MTISASRPVLLADAVVGDDTPGAVGEADRGVRGLVRECSV